MVTRIAFTGTHSTGKTTLIRRIEMELRATGLKVTRTPASFAAKAAELGFPKLQKQTPQCTEWIISASAAAVAEATLNAEVVLIDRSAVDPLAYYLAALERTGQDPDQATVGRLARLVQAHASTYDLLIATVLDPAIPLGDHRDRDLDYRKAVDRSVHSLLNTLYLRHKRVTSADFAGNIADTLAQHIGAQATS
ncbi:MULTISPECIES: AAA family ATPase [unclassified Streptomyces]|uniref:AAA family ATPase n=1 Tax=Streptomyces sp. NPDC055082 TaxID=3365718 RepID=UPI0037D74614